MLGRVPQATLERAAADPRFLAPIAGPASAIRRLSGTARTTARRSVDRVFFHGIRPGGVHAHLFRRPRRALRRSYEGRRAMATSRWSASACSIRKATCSSRLNPDGWQQERNPVNDFYTLPVRPVRDEQTAMKSSVQVKLPTGERVHQGLAHRRRPREALSARYQHSGKRSGRTSRDHRSALRRRYSHAHPPGDRARHRRPARPARIGPEAHRLSHERRPLGVSGHRAHARC